MAFVNVVGGNEIYNFRIHHFVHFYSRIWSFWCSNRGSANKFVSTALCAMTSRRRPRRSCPCAARGDLRPRLAAVPGCAAPKVARATRRIGVRARATRRVGWTRPFGLAVRPRPHPRVSYYGRDITPSSPLVGPSPI
jgi:hypothetical protein